MPAGAGGRPPLPPGPHLVLGLARSGQAAARALARHGEQVIAVDDGHPSGAGALADEGIEVHLGGSPETIVHRAQTLVESPGIPHDAPLAAAARTAGLEVIGELELAWRLLANPFAVVTGTNGKTTTVQLLGRILGEAGVPVAVAGNVGTPLASLVGTLNPGAWVACEASSFQLEDATAFAPDAAILLNLTEDHLDRHGSMAAYTAAKLQAFVRQGPEALAVLPLGLDSELGVPGAARRVRFAPLGAPAVEGVELVDDHGTLRWRGEVLIAGDEIALPGLHNRLNAMAAAAAALGLGVPAAAVRTALREFRGVAHRLETVAQRDGVRWVNDSKATNVASTLVALRCFPRHTVHLIAGGREKSGYAGLRAEVAQRCAAVYLIGEAAPTIDAALEGVDVPRRSCGELAVAVAAAAAAVRPGDVVLLSPACASYDQFVDFEERGDRFRGLAAAQAGPGPRPG